MWKWLLGFPRAPSGPHRPRDAIPRAYISASGYTVRGSKFDRCLSDQVSRPISQPLSSTCPSEHPWCLKSAWVCGLPEQPLCVFPTEARAPVPALRQSCRKTFRTLWLWQTGLEKSWLSGSPGLPPPKSPHCAGYRRAPDPGPPASPISVPLPATAFLGFFPSLSPRLMERRMLSPVPSIRSISNQDRKAALVYDIDFNPSLA